MNSGAKALWTLIPLSLIYGVAAVLLFRKLTDRASIRRTVKRILAHVMELSLFLDSPSLVFRAQRDLLLENLRLLRLVIAPAGILGLIFVLAYSWLDRTYGLAPLPVGEPSVVSLRFKDALRPVELESANLAIGAMVRVPRDREIDWRVRPLAQDTGGLRFRIDDRMVTANAIYFYDPVIRSIEIRYPRAEILGFSWLAWFLVISTFAALALELSWKR